MHPGDENQIGIRPFKLLPFLLFLHQFHVLLVDLVHPSVLVLEYDQNHQGFHPVLVKHVAIVYKHIAVSHLIFSYGVLKKGIGKIVMNGHGSYKVLLN